MPASIAFRRSIRWIPEEASEYTDTIVLTGPKTGVFLDVRFIRDTNNLDWAFAGYRSSVAPNKIRFEHYIDSRTLNASQVDDYGTNAPLPDGTTLEIGEMINPATGKMTAYEEVWEDEEHETAMFIRNTECTEWRARVGNWQLGLGRAKDGIFWAWQAKRHEEEGSVDWEVKHSVGGPEKVSYLREKGEIEWIEGDTVIFDGQEWLVIEKVC